MSVARGKMTNVQIKGTVERVYKHMDAAVPWRILTLSVLYVKRGIVERRTHAAPPRRGGGMDAAAPWLGYGYTSRHSAAGK